MDDSYLKLKVEFGRNDIEFGKNIKKINFRELEESLVYQYVDLELFDMRNEEHGKLIASLTGIYFDLEYIYNNHLSIYDAFDMINGDTFSVFDILFDKDENLKEQYEALNSNIFYLDRIFVEDKYRNKGYAKLLLNQLDELIRYVLKLRVGIIIVYAQPFEKIKGNMIRDDKVLKNKLIKLYENTGFTKTEDNSDYLFKIDEDY